MASRISTWTIGQYCRVGTYRNIESAVAASRAMENQSATR